VYDVDIIINQHEVLLRVISRPMPTKSWDVDDLRIYSLIIH